jgi:hypothetical protein
MSPCIEDTLSPARKQIEQLFSNKFVIHYYEDTPNVSESASLLFLVCLKRQGTIDG